MKKKERMGKKYDPKNLLIKDQRSIEEKSKLLPEEAIAEIVTLRRQKAYDEGLSDTALLESEYSDEFIDIPDMPRLEGEEVKEGKGLKILTPNKLLTRLPILLAQVKAGNNSYKLKNEVRRQILYLLYQHSKITKKVYNNLIESL